MEQEDKVWVNNRDITPFVVIQEKQIIGEGVRYSDGTFAVYWYRIGIHEQFTTREELLAQDQMDDVQIHIGQPFRYTMMEPRW